MSLKEGMMKEIAVLAFFILSAIGILIGAIVYEPLWPWFIPTVILAYLSHRWEANRED
jgi:hypothetical protein